MVKLPIILGILVFFISMGLISVLLLRLRSSPRLITIGDYNLLEMIWKGRMSTLYRAKNRVLNHVAVVKILDPIKAKDKAMVRQFLGEGEVLAQINNEFPDSPVVKVIEYGYNQTNGLYFISMDYLGGSTLRKHMEQAQQLKLYEKLYIIKEVARAMICFHSLNIYHRDIAPENILIDGKRVTLIDFGIAIHKWSSYITMLDTIVGRPDYMSPEQCTGKTISNKSDIYSLGAVLFYLLEGKPLYKSPYLHDKIQMHVDEPTPEITQPIPDELKKFIYKMLSKDPAMRPDVFEVMNEMEFFMEKES